MNLVTDEIFVNESIKKKIEDVLDWTHAQKLHDEGMPLCKISVALSCSLLLLTNGVKSGLLIRRRTPRPPISEETRLLMSNAKKQWFIDNPEKHPWRRKGKCLSKPCERVKEFLTSLNIPFISEYPPNIAGRFFSIDIAMPDKKIAIEINGTQHYENDGKTLKPYYQERHNLLENAGWIVYEIHFNLCFRFDKWTEFVNALRVSDVKVEFDYFNYKNIPRPRKIYRCCDCQSKIGHTGDRCIRCANVAATRLRYPHIKEFPEIETLKQLLLENPLSTLCKQFNMSDRTLSRKVKKLGINIPPQGHWNKFR